MTCSCHYPLQLYEKISVTISNLNYNTEFFQKIFQIFSSIILLKIADSTSPVLSRLSRVFSTVNLQDFYRLFKTPEEILFPIHVQSIDENGLLNLLTIELQKQLGNDDYIKDFTKAVLEKHLKDMDQNGDGYKTPEDFSLVLQNRFRALKIVTRNSHTYDFSKVHLKNLQVPLKRISLIAKIEWVLWIFTNSGCLLIYMREWDLFDASKWAVNMGKSNSLGNSVKGIACSALCLKILEGFRQILWQPVTEQGRRNAIWQIVTASFDLLSTSAALLNSVGSLTLSATILPILAIIAKSVGLLEIITRPSRKYFEAINA